MVPSHGQCPVGSDNLLPEATECGATWGRLQDHREGNQAISSHEQMDDPVETPEALQLRDNTRHKNLQRCLHVSTEWPLLANTTALGTASVTLTVKNH